MRQQLQNKHFLSSARLKNFGFLAFIFSLFFICLIQQVHSKQVIETEITLSKDLTTPLSVYLTELKAHLTQLVNKEKEDILPRDEQEFARKIDQIATMSSLTSAKIDSLKMFLDNQSKHQSTLNQRLKHLQQLPIVNAEEAVELRVKKIEHALDTNNSTIELINENLDLSNQYQLLLKNNVKKLNLWHANFALEQKLMVIKQEKIKLNNELKSIYANSITKDDFKKEHNNLLKGEVHFEAYLLLNNQKIALIQSQLNRLVVQKKVIKADISLLQNSDAKTLQATTDDYNEAISQLTKIEKAEQHMLDTLKKEVTLFHQAGLIKSVESLVSRVQEQIKQVGNEKNIVLNGLAQYQLQLRSLVSSRQSLSEYNKASVPIILNKILAMPNLFFQYMKTLTLKVYDSYSWLNNVQQACLLGFLFFNMAVCLLINIFLKNLKIDKERSRLTGYLYDGVLVVVQRNLPYISLVIMLQTIFYFTNISFSNYELFFNLIGIVFTFKILILISRLVLLERISDSSGKDVKLYHRLKWLLLFGGWTTGLMVFSHLYPLSNLIQDIFNRLFMMFLLAISIVAWKSKDVIPYLLNPLLSSQKRYFRNAVFLLIFLVPITLFSTALIGLSGFVNLAWKMSVYQAYVLIVSVGYTLARGLVLDALELCSEWMISSLKNGWLWIEVFLKPLDKVIRIILMLASTLVLFQIFGWHSDSLVIINLIKLAHYSFISLPGIHITVSSIIGFVIVLSLFVWASKWSREFCYRWLFKNAKDVGVRNSLSVFTQYAIILLGTFITLHVLGVDFSGMSFILGGLAVGMGLGLKDFASNIIGGIMLLIERPVREGDIISLGEHEGRVEHIGLRTMRIFSNDNTEVLIPNAETFNKAFTNWTLQDSIVRTIVPIKVSRSDDPVIIQQLILDVLATTPEIVTFPVAQVFLMKIDEALIEFEARYFINVQVHARFEVRSKVLFAITAQFKKAGIKPPIEQMTIEIKEGKGARQTPKEFSPNN